MWSLLRHAQSRIDLRIARKFEFDRNNLDLQKTSVMGKFTRELLRRIESKVCSSLNVEVNASHPHIVCHVVGNMDTCTVGTQVDWSVRDTIISRYAHTQQLQCSYVIWRLV